MEQEQIKFKQLSAKLVGSNVVNYRLEDGTLMKIHVELARIGVAMDRKAPDGSPLYNANIGTRVEFENKDKTFYAPPPAIPTRKAIDTKASKDYTA
jgi:hypothetical protein